MGVAITWREGNAPSLTREDGAEGSERRGEVGLQEDRALQEEVTLGEILMNIYAIDSLSY